VRAHIRSKSPFAARGVVPRTTPNYPHTPCLIRRGNGSLIRASDEFAGASSGGPAVIPTRPDHRSQPDGGGPIMTADDALVARARLA